ncbi:RNA-directed DNA polymerase [Candidatus Poribacteria bacterium]|nr:RNA-directed DNA polymerase [Candidatus Poribacteria bacterium]
MLLLVGILVLAVVAAILIAAAAVKSGGSPQTPHPAQAGGRAPGAVPEASGNRFAAPPGANFTGPFDKKKWLINPDWREADPKAASRYPRAEDRRRQWSLPILDNPEDVVRFLDLGGFGVLVNLCDPNLWSSAAGHSVPNPAANYRFRSIPKRGGGVRFIAAPKPRLKAAQRRILREILDKVPVHDAATAFRPRRSVADHARPHVGRQLILAYDLQDFFPRIRHGRVAGLFRWLGYPASVARCLALLCTCSDSMAVSTQARHLPQGAPTSPAIANLLCFRLDCRLTGLAKKFGASYTRYADDLAFSGDNEFKRGITRFIPLAEKIIRNEGFVLNKQKRRFMRHGRCQRLTGLKVNDSLSVGREESDLVKAILHNAKKAGSLESQNRQQRGDFEAHLRGRISWISQFHPARGAKLLAELDKVTGFQRRAGPPAITPPD